MRKPTWPLARLFARKNDTALGRSGPTMVDAHPVFDDWRPLADENLPAIGYNVSPLTVVRPEAELAWVRMRLEAELTEAAVDEYNGDCLDSEIDERHADRLRLILVSEVTKMQENTDARVKLQMALASASSKLEQARKVEAELQAEYDKFKADLVGDDFPAAQPIDTNTPAAPLPAPAAPPPLVPWPTAATESTADPTQAGPTLAVQPGWTWVPTSDAEVGAEHEGPGLFKQSGPSLVITPMPNDAESGPLAAGGGN